MTVPSLQLIAWPSHAGLRDVSMGLGASVLGCRRLVRRARRLRHHGRQPLRLHPYAAPGGPSLDALIAGIDGVFDRFEVAAAALMAYDPRVDGDGGVAAAARRIAARIARHVAYRRLTRAER